MEKPWHAASVAEVARALQVDPARGLEAKECRRRLVRYGPNKLSESERVRPLTILIKQFQDFMVLVLLGAGAVSFALGEVIDAAAILAIVAINAVLGFIQEYRAERSLSILKEMTAPTTTVRRGGRPEVVPAAEIVPGDILLLKEGDRAPADARIVKSAALSVDESPLTGESVPARKSAEWVGDPRAELAERRNMIHMGTTVTRGWCEAIVVKTGMATEIGDIAALIGKAKDEETPLQRRLEQLGRWLVAACALVVALVFTAGVLRGLPVFDMFLTGVSLAVAAIPEGLPAVVTVALAIGVQRMIRKNAIVRRLPAVETLGCATVICSDKTGTLTRNEMTVIRLILGKGEVEVTGAGYNPQGEFRMGGRILPPSDPDLGRALIVAAGCNRAHLVTKGSTKGAGARRKDRGGWRIIGDPTEGALLVCASKGGLTRRAFERRYRLVGEIPFDSDRKRMSVLVEGEDGLFSLVKGAPDTILDACRKIQVNGVVRELGPGERRRLKEEAEALAGRALRVLALAYRKFDRDEAAVLGQKGEELPEKAMERDLVFTALAAMMDPPRPEAARAVALARRAGIRTIMVTGDHPRTAKSVAESLGFPRTEAMTGKDLDALDEAGLKKRVSEVDVFARVSPRHKLRIVRSLKSLGHIVAMTGDGVNDAPAVKEADIGVAMGVAGTDVTKEASSMVLADDNFATLVAAIEEGRGIYDNVRKFIRYLLACNTGEVLAMFLGTILGMPLPLLPVQILWVNLVTDGLPAIALGVDPTDPDVMERPPRHPKEGVFARGLHLKIAVRGALIGVCTVAAFVAGMALAPVGGDQALAHGRTLALTTLVVSQLIYVFQCRSERRTLFESSPFGNPWLLGAAAASFAMHLAILYWDDASRIFHTVPLGVEGWIVALAFSGWSQVLEWALVALRRAGRKRISLLRV